MDLYQYDDYRVWLRGKWDELRRLRGHLTCRQFASEAGFSNPGFLGDVIAGRRHLSSEATDKVVKAFGLGEREAEFLRLLVLFQRERNQEIRADLYSRILFRRNRSSFSRMEPAKGRYYQDPRYPLVRAAIESQGFRGDYERLAASLDPPLQAAVVRRCIRDLCQWGLLEQTMDGSYRVTRRFVEPSPTQGELVRRLNRHWFLESAAAIDRFAPDKRHVSTMMLNISEETAQQVRERLEKFREEIFELVEKDQAPVCTMQLSLAYFPRTRVRKEKQS